MSVKTGLQNMAEAYGLERGGAAEFKSLAHRFIELFAENLARMVKRRIRLIGSVSLSLESFANYFSAPAQQAFIIRRPGAEHLAVRIDPDLAGALIGGALGGIQVDGGSQSAGAASATPIRLTPAETRLAGRLLKDALAASARAALAATLGESTAVIVDGAAEMAEAGDPLLKMAVAAGRLSLNGREAGFAVGLPLSALPAPNFRPEAPRARPREGATPAMRARLGGARMALAAVLGAVELPFNAVRKLTPGSIIMLGKLEGPAPRVELRYGDLSLCAGTVIEECGWHRFLIQAGGPN